LEDLLTKQRERFAEGWLSPAQVLFGSGELKEKMPDGVSVPIVRMGKSIAPAA
jgi:hypothetical protein